MIRVNSWVRRVRVIELLFSLKLYYNLALEILTIEQTKLVDQSTNKYMDPIFICVALLFTISQCSLMNYKKRNNFSDACNLGSYALNQRNMYLLMYWFIFQIQKLSSSSPIILFLFQKLTNVFLPCCCNNNNRSCIIEQGEKNKPDKLFNAHEFDIHQEIVDRNRFDYCIQQCCWYIRSTYCFQKSYGFGAEVLL